MHPPKKYPLDKDPWICDLGPDSLQPDDDGVMPPTPVQPDPRTPIQKLIQAWQLEKEKSADTMVAIVNDALQASSEAAAANLPKVGEDPAADAAIANANDWVKAADSVAKAEDAYRNKANTDAHMSDSAPVFKDWHLSQDAIKAEFERELRVPISDEAILKDIAAARAMIPTLPAKPESRSDMGGALVKQPKGHMFLEKQPVPKLLADESVKDDDLTSEQFGTWLYRALRRKYEAAKAEFDPICANDAAEGWLQKRDGMFIVSSCQAIFAQEGAPSAINTWDDNTITWGVGIAEAGMLGKVFGRLTKEPAIAKALYLCGFYFERAPPMLAPWNYGYHVVSLMDKVVAYRDQSIHNTNDKKKKDDFLGKAHTTLEIMGTETELLRLLIQIARDPLTRRDVFEENYSRVEGMAALGATLHIKTEALFVFASEVRHEWGLDSKLVQWAVNNLEATMQKEVRSVEKDFEIAKWICRRVLLWIQARAIFDTGWKFIVEKNANARKKLPPPAPKPVKTKFPYGIQQLYQGQLGKGYWMALLDGSRTGRKKEDQKGLLSDASEDFKKKVNQWLRPEGPPPLSEQPPPPPALHLLAHDSRLVAASGKPAKDKWFVMGPKVDTNFNVDTFLPLGFHPEDVGNGAYVKDVTLSDITVTLQNGTEKVFDRMGNPR